MLGRFEYRAPQSEMAGGTRRHGVLMIAERGKGLRIPENVRYVANLSVYGQVFSEWTKKQ